jgi:glycosyltransferase involved in cell wall biosynthesis
MQLISGAAFRTRSLHPLAGVTVLQLVAELDTSPAARAAIETAEALLRVGGTPLVAATGGSMVSELQARGGIFIRFPTQTTNPLELALGAYRLARLIRGEAIDIVHARSRLSAWIAFSAARLTRTPFVTSFPASFETSGGFASYANSILAHGDRILVEWNHAARMTESCHPMAKGRIHVTGPGVDRRAFAEDSVPPARVLGVRRRWGSPPDEPIVLFLGEPEASEEGTILGATARILRRSGARHPRLVHIEAGPGSRGCTIDPAAEVPRRLPPCEDLPAALRAASVIAIPSGRAEAVCRLAVEAQATGTPVVVADEGALGETVLAPPDSTDSTRTGWRIPPGEPKALAEAIIVCLRLGASARVRLALRARTFVDHRLSIDRMRSETLRAFVAARSGAEEA